VIAGAGDDLEDLLAIVERERIQDVTFTGRVDDTTKMRLMQEAWVFAMPSMVEGWGIVVMEAAACATPSVAYDVNGLRDCIIQDQTGVLARNDDEFVAGLRDLLKDGDRRSRLSAGALSWSREFSWDRAARQTLRTIRLAQPWRAVFESDEGTTTRLRLRRRHDQQSPPAEFTVGTADGR
jgi:glycosyltransferase involved in cell wall biosynthesis